MGFIQELLKDRETHVVQAEQSVMEVARFMVERNIGAVPVMRSGLLAGIFSERDLMKRVVAERRDPERTRVSEVMTANPHSVSREHTLEQCMTLMREHGFRHLPIAEGGKLYGLLSMRDLLMHDIVEKDGEVQMMRAYISGT